MDGIAAVEARIAEIRSRFAPPPPAAAASSTAVSRTASGADFASHLRTAMGDADTWIDTALARTGAPQSWATGLKEIAAHESSLDPTAANIAASGGNPAKTPLGLMQMLPSTFAAHAQPGHGDIADPVDNLCAAIDYIKKRYGDPAHTPGLQALARGDRYVGY